MAKRTRVTFEYRHPIADVFMRRKPCVILCELLKEDCCSINTLYKNSSGADTMYGYVMNIVHDFREAGMVETEKRGRSLIIRLTKKGKDIALKVKEINDKL
jgi:predicted transcriptional regulator